MGTSQTLLNVNDQILDSEILINKYLYQYEFEMILRQDALFKSIIVTSTNKNISTSKLNLELTPGTPLIIKIFPRKNENYLKYSQEFENIKSLYSNLQSTPNVLPILEILDIKEANVGVIIKQYIKYNLSEAFYYLRCVSEIEKKWICFQLLQSVSQIHSKGKCHGDIKPDNVLLTSKLSVFLTDISVYKPVFLFINNLQAYNYFFYSNPNDINQSCYIAPERFINDISEIKNKKDELTPEMDIFSLGALMAEIFLEHKIFDQNTIIDYKNNIFNLNNGLKGIKDDLLRITLYKMMLIDPGKRLSLKEAIFFFGNCLCPPPISRFYIHMNKMIIAFNYYKNDLLVALIYKHFQQIWKCLTYKNRNHNIKNVPILEKKLNNEIIILLLNSKKIYEIPIDDFPLVFIANKNKTDFIENNINENFLKMQNNNNANNNVINDNTKDDCSILLIRYLISCLENIKYNSTYYLIFEMLIHLSRLIIENNNTHILLEIVIPYIINLFKLKETNPKIEAFNCVINLLNLIDYENFELDYNSFNYYIFDKIYNLYFNCNEIEVKISILNKIDKISELQIKFLNSILLNFSNKKTHLNKTILNSSFVSSNMLFMSHLGNMEKSFHQEKNINFTFKEIYKKYLEDLTDFKKKLNKIINHVMTEEMKNNDNDSLKLVLISKITDLCLFYGNLNENKELINYLLIVYKQNNKNIQKEIIKIFPNLIYLFGKKLYDDYFLIFLEYTFQNNKKIDEQVIIQIIDTIFLLNKLNIINTDDDYSKIYKILIPYLLHPNYMIRYKVSHLLCLFIKKNPISKLYILLNKDVKNIIYNLICSNSNTDNETMPIINIINIENNNNSSQLIPCIYKSKFIPRIIYLLNKKGIELTNIIDPLDKRNNFLNTLPFFINNRKNDYVISNTFTDNHVLINDYNDKIKIRSLYSLLKISIIKYLNSNNKNYSEKNFITQLIILYNKYINCKNKTSFQNFICQNKISKFYIKSFLLLVTFNNNLNLDNQLNPPEIETLKQDSTLMDFEEIKKSFFESITYTKKWIPKGKLIYKLVLNESESIIKLIALSNKLNNCSLNMFISVSDEGIIRLHAVHKENFIDDIFVIKNLSQYQINLIEDDGIEFILKKNNISVIEFVNKIIVLVAINKKISIVDFELDLETISNANKNKNFNDLEESNLINNLECNSEKEIISLSKDYNYINNYLILGNEDNSISFYNYNQNTITYLNEKFSQSFGNIDSIININNSNNIIITTTKGLLILFDYKLRMYTDVFYFTPLRRIKSISQLIPQSHDKYFLSENNNQNLLFILLTEDDEIILWDLLKLKPIIIYRFFKAVDNEYKNKLKLYKVSISNVKKLNMIENSKIIENEDELVKNSEYSVIKFENSEIKNCIKILEIPINIDLDKNKFNLHYMIIGEKNGTMRLLHFNTETLDKIKQGEKKISGNNIFYTENKNIVESYNYAKFKKTEKVFINKIFDQINGEEPDDNSYEEINDLVIFKYSVTQDNFIITSHFNGKIKLWK